MRPGPGKLAVVVLLAFTVASCSSSDAKPPKLMDEYLESTEVDNDTFRVQGADTEQITKNVAEAKKSKDVTVKEAVQAFVLSAYSCDGYYNGPPYPSCDFGDEAQKAITEATGPDGTTHVRSLLVKGQDGALAFVSVYVANGGTDDAVLVDSTGQTYHGGLSDFRENNSVLSRDDWVLAPADITAVAKDDEIPLEIEAVTVRGQTPGTWGWWLGAAGLVVVLFLGYVWFNWSPSTRRRAPDNSDAGMLGSL